LIDAAGISLQDSKRVFILPVNRENETRTTPWVMIALLVAFAAAPWYYTGARQLEFFRIWGFVPQDHRLLSVFSSMFLHAGLWHLLGNAWFFWMFGKKVEEAFGKLLFILLFLACGLGGSGLHYLFNMDSSIPCVGASGAISGIAGAFFVMFPRTRFDLCIFLLRWNVKTIETRTHAALGAWVGEQTLLGLITQGLGASGVAYWAHIGGFATGLVLTLGLRSVVQNRKREDWSYLTKSAEE
jgi:membrane associated rhomboid family serine protease